MKVWIALNDDGECRHIVGVFFTKERARTYIKKQLSIERAQFKKREAKFKELDPKHRSPGFTSDLHMASYEEWEVIDG